MEQLTVRGFDSELERRLRELAEREGLSLSQAALRLLRRGAGLEPLPVGTTHVGHALDAFFGVWSDDEARAFEEALAPTERIDPDLWG